MTFQDEDQDEVVISGVSGKFPEAESVGELAEKLFAGEHLVTKDERKLTKGFYENLPEYNGKTRTNSIMFDNTFFGISKIVAIAMDPLTCQILERTFEAVIDAGINPSELRGSNSVVYSGTCHSDSDLEWATDTKSGYGIMGRNRCMNSNRVSYWLDLNGHSVSIDNNWTSGLTNLYLGWKAIKSGVCDTAIVSTASLQCHALITIQFKDFGLLSPDGISRTFDDSGNGYGRSSSIVVFVLQRARRARRSYATIGHVLTSCLGDREGVINRPLKEDWVKLLTEFYKESKIDVKDVQYIEAHGSSKREEDAEELNAIAEVFCKDRTSPLLVGCIKSNIGNTEASSSFCGVVKNIIAFENNKIPQNLHYKNPNSLVPALVKGQIKVVDRNTAINTGGWFAVNSHGFGGTYGHIVLKANPKTKCIKYDNVPRLVLLSDRTDEYIEGLIEKVESSPYDPEFIGLLHEVHSRKVEKYLSRGYTIVPVKDKPVHDHQVFAEEKRPIWFIFSGMGSQWPKMGKRLMDLPVFRESIEKSHKVLQAKGVDLIKIITEDDPKMFDNILHSFVGIAAIQVALVDFMRTLNIVPDGLIGHSVGELGCAYADGCFTAEQMVLAAYYRGRASTETELIRGSMAAVGKGYNDIKDELPEGVEVACHNSEDSCTLSGPADLIHKFVAELKEKGIFARSVNVSNIAYHSRYIRPAAPKLLNYLKEVVPEAKLRSPKWISTSNPESKWDTDVAKYCSAEYHTNNLLSSVLFEEGSKHIPKNAICIEIAPHGLLQAILKRSLGEDVTNIPLTSRSADDSLVFLLQAVGKMYMAGIDPNILNLYPRIEYPVSRGTPGLHGLVHWHDKEVATVVTPMEKKIIYSLKSRLVSTAEDGTGYMCHNENIYPVAIFLQLAWEIFASLQKVVTEECPLVFEDFKIKHLLPIHLSEDDDATITFQIGTGNFEIMTNDSLLASGKVSLLEEIHLESNVREINNPDLTTEEIYKEIKRKGYEVGSHFRNLSKVTFDSEKELRAEIPAKSNWVQIIESLFQVYLLNANNPMGYTLFPNYFERLEISSLQHKEFKSSLNESSGLPIAYDFTTNIAQCGGFKLKGLQCLEVPKITDLKFPSNNFFPFINPSLENSLKFAEFSFGIVLDNMNTMKNLAVINILEVMDEKQTGSIGMHLQNQFRDIKTKVKTVKNPRELNDEDTADFVITPLAHLDKCVSCILTNGFILLRSGPGKRIPAGFTMVGKFLEGPNEELQLLKKVGAFVEDPEFLSMDGSQTLLINNIRKLKPSQQSVYVFGHKEPLEGIVSFRRKMQAETIVPLRWILILDKTAPPFDNQNPFYAEQLKIGLVTNVYKNGGWGGFYEYNFSDSVFLEDVNFCLESSPELKPAYVTFDLTDNILKLQQIEFSGKVNNTNVMGISKLSNHKKIILDKYLMWEVPKSWSLEDAATVPLAHALAYYCIVIEGHLHESERILITDGLSCLGQASVAVALTIASRVFVTVNNDAEVGLIRKQFPQLKESDVMNHNDPQFTTKWILRNNEELLGIVINTLERDHFFSLFDLLRRYGRYFYFGTEVNKENEKLGAAVFLNCLELFSLTPEKIIKFDEQDKKKLHALVAEGIKSGVVKPLQRMIVPFNELKKVPSKVVQFKARSKTLVPFESIKQNLSYIRFDDNSSYLVIGDETDTWIDVAEWLQERGLQKVVVGRRDNTRRSQLRLPHLKKKNILIRDNEDVETLLREAKKLGPISSVYYLSMNSTDADQTLLSLDKNYRDKSGHFLAISKTRGVISEMCNARNQAGFPSTNFIWDADEVVIKENLEFMSKLCGRDSVIHASRTTTLLASDRKLIDLLPSTIEDFCSLGSSLEKQVRITPLQTRTGVNRESTKEFTPLIFVPGLHNDPVAFLQPVVSSFLYPVACVQIPDMKLSIPKMASFILPEIVKFNQGNVYNIVGYSWGTNLAVELAKQLEEIESSVVGLTLIEGPLLDARALVTKSLESDLLSLIQTHSKAATYKAPMDILPVNTWEGQLNHALGVLNLPPEKEKDFCRAIMFIYNNLQALMDHDTSDINLKGPLTVLVCGQLNIEEKTIWKISNSIRIRNLNLTSEEVLMSEELWKAIHAAAVSPAMSPDTIHTCAWPALDDFMNQKRVLKLGHDFQALSVKFTFSR